MTLIPQLKPLRHIALATALAVSALPVSGFVASTPVMAQGPVSVADLAEGLLDSVVNISTRQSVEAEAPSRRNNRPQLPEGSPFQEFFDEFFDQQRPGQPQQRSGPRSVSSLGSGFVIDAEEGIIITNNHVIADADEIEINFSDGDTLEATLIGRDPKTDIAVLKVDPEKKKLVAVPFGDSEKARIGDWVMAIGNPFGLGGTVTVGIISAQNRNINSGPYDRFIQTDAAINRGNSGGPLFNMNGEVIGINTAIISPSGGSIGIGFSIPSELAAGVVNQLREFGETRRGYLGVRIQPVTDEIAESLGLDETKGVLVSGVLEGGPVSDGTIEAGDVILSFDGTEVNDPRDLSRTVADTAVGKSVDVEIMRKGKKEVVKVELGRLEDGEQALAAADGATDQSADAKPEKMEVLGLTLGMIDDELREKYSLEESIEGVVILAVEEGSEAQEKGLREGDVIVEVAQEAVKTTEDLTKRLEELKDDDRKNALLMVSSSNGQLRFFTLRMD